MEEIELRRQVERVAEMRRELPIGGLRDGKIRHFWSEEIGENMADPGQDPRSAVEMDPMWLLLDTTPGGRGEDWHPSLTY